jgi:two-component system, NtrC family, sensor kinase
MLAVATPRVLVNSQPPEQELERVIDAMAQHVVIVDATGMVTTSNRAWRKFMRVRGVPDDAWQRRSYVDLCLEMAGDRPVPRHELEQSLLAVIAGDADRFTCELRLDVAGEPNWMTLSAHSLPAGGAVFSHHDITQIRALDRARARFAQLTDASTDAILIVNAEGRVDYSNDAAQRLAGASAPDDDRSVDRLVDRAALAIAASDGAWRGEVTLHTRDGAEIPVLQDVRRHEPPAAGEPPYFTIVLHDISAEKSRENELHTRNVELSLAYTHLKNAQEQLLQSEKMASIGQLAAGVAHEINNPIGYVHSNLGTLRDYTRNLFTLLASYESALADAQVADGRRRELDEMRQRLEIDFLAQDLPQLVAESAEGIERVRKIVQDLKDFSHVGHADAWETVDVHRGLDSTLNIVWNEIKYKAEVHKHYGELPPVQCLPSQLNQVFLNLLVNAAQAMPNRGTISISTGVQADCVWIAISDTGQGIPEANLARIFDPFFTTKPVGQGTGLGLSLSYGIVKKHHGRIDVETRVGAGTTFTVVLPIVQPS